MSCLKFRKRKFYFFSTILFFLPLTLDLFGIEYTEDSENFKPSQFPPPLEFGTFDLNKPRRLIPYHGMRLSTESKDFYIKRIFAKKITPPKDFPPLKDDKKNDLEKPNFKDFQSQNDFESEKYPPLPPPHSDEEFGPPPPPPFYPLENLENSENSEKNSKNERKKKEIKNILEINVCFSIPIDPRSINEKSILLDGKPVVSKKSKIATIHYNRTGTVMRISIENPKKTEYSLKLANIKSFNQVNLETKAFSKISDGFSYLNKKSEKSTQNKTQN